MSPSFRHGGAAALVCATCSSASVIAFCSDRAAVATALVRHMSPLQLEVEVLAQLGC